jgi:hypothetical protein
MMAMAVQSAQLKERSIPFVLHNGYDHAASACGGGGDTRDQVIASVVQVLRRG